MKKLIAILGFTFILIGCNKNNANHIPANYIGNWTGREGGFFGINYCIEINTNGKGTFTKAAFFKSTEKGKVKISGKTLSIGKLEFEINDPPEPNKFNFDKYEMTLDGICYQRQ
ncbi:hypothetical protein [Crocinitomix catalasitica]|uniref:hypothetical protein n=1 Tax=Crocinitomix catalasitica TaxID=184607 RepID=UPI00047FD656|nr:hypothetical protein [Crocinitomix catalasitica]